jgi:uncharacterized membrane protein
MKDVFNFLADFWPFLLIIVIGIIFVFFREYLLKKVNEKLISLISITFLSLMVGYYLCDFFNKYDSIGFKHKAVILFLILMFSFGIYRHIRKVLKQ